MHKLYLILIILIYTLPVHFYKVFANKKILTCTYITYNHVGVIEVIYIPLILSEIECNRK